MIFRSFSPIPRKAAGMGRRPSKFAIINIPYQTDSDLVDVGINEFRETAHNGRWAVFSFLK